MNLTQRRSDHSEKEEVMTCNEIGTLILDCAVALHRELGPGLLESVYETVLAHDL